MDMRHYHYTLGITEIHHQIVVAISMADSIG